MKTDSSPSAMEGRDAQVRSELKAVGGRSEEAWGQISKLSDTIGELHQQIDQFQDMV